MVNWHGHRRTASVGTTTGQLQRFQICCISQLICQEAQSWRSINQLIIHNGRRREKQAGIGAAKAK